MIEFFFSKDPGCKPATLLRNELLHKCFSRVLLFVKYTRIRAFTDLHFLVYGQNCIRIFQYIDRIADSVHIRENTDTICPYTGKSGSEKGCILAYLTKCCLLLRNTYFKEHLGLSAL